MNENTLLEICQQLDLGLPTNRVTPVTGGLLHQMWKLETDKGCYVIKQLSQDIKLTPKTIQAYQITERIAEQFKHQGIPAISAIKKHDRYLIIIEDTAFLVYPWVNAKALHKDAISEKHALQIASLLAKMHKLNLQVVELEEPTFDIHSDEQIRGLINSAIDSECAFSSILKEHHESILAMNRAYQHAATLMKSRTVISHGDLDQKNVLWDQAGNPILIDWESARKLNPTYEIINASLDWSGITTAHFDSALCINMIKAYVSAGGIIDMHHVQAAFYGVLGNWLNWMVYNIVRASKANDLELQAIGTEQVQQVVPTLLRLESLISVLVEKIRDTG